MSPRSSLALQFSHNSKSSKGRIRPQQLFLLLRNRTFWKYLLLLASIIISSVIFILAVPYNSNHRHKSLLLTIDRAQESLSTVPPTYRANATYVMLCRNKELKGVLWSVRQIEDRFNEEAGYPWVFLNDEPFSEEFKTRVKLLIKGKAEFGLIPSSHWNQPDWVDEEKATEGRKKLVEQMIIYADSVPYRNMCRFNSGFFFHHPLMQQYRYYWRIEPDVDYFCDVTYDPFTFMEVNKKVYGWTISLLEWYETVPTLWDATKEFITKNPQYVHPDNAMEWISNDGGNSYNMCHFWSNFEIADMNFWRGEAYQKYFEHLDSKGGFYYERWGDAPVHSLAVSLFVPKDAIHYFYDIGYRHDGFRHCPNHQVWTKGRCWCDPGRSFNNRKGASCTRQFVAMQNTLY
ncbi:glycosyltransferase family 15 protein [Coprinopsis sp. MPI-PUGE-AT-0042]|nr:glycosyltransferase family 15 protein [Coprinopsis sp. MPI-PUGE-AT-0042]